MITSNDRLPHISDQQNLYNLEGGEPESQTEKICKSGILNLGSDKKDARLGRDDISYIQSEISKRKRLKYGYRDLVSYVLCCVICRRKKSLKKRLKKHVLVEKGRKKLAKELDAVTIVKSIRQLKLLTKILMNNQQKLLLGF